MIILDDGFMPHVKSEHKVASYIEAILCFEITNLFGLSCIKYSPSLNVIASNGLGLDLYCNVIVFNNPRRIMQDVPSAIIFEKKLFLVSYFISYHNPVNITALSSRLPKLDCII